MNEIQRALTHILIGDGNADAGFIGLKPAWALAAEKEERVRRAEADWQARGGRQARRAVRAQGA